MDAIPPPLYENSAGRLLAILDALSTRNSTEKGLQFAELLVKVFYAPPYQPSDPSERSEAAYFALSFLHEIYRGVCEDVVSDPHIKKDTRAVLQRSIVKLRETIFPRNIEAHYRPPADTERSILELCATEFMREDRIGSDDLEKIREAIVGLRVVVDTADISPTLRKSLLELIRLSEDAISRYNIHGARGLRKVFKSMMGEAAEIWQELPPEEKQRNDIWQPIRKLLKVVDNAAAAAMKYKPLLEVVLPHLLTHG
jgi:hypothetical protein